MEEGQGSGLFTNLAIALSRRSHEIAKESRDGRTGFFVLQTHACDGATQQRSDCTALKKRDRRLLKEPKEEQESLSEGKTWLKYLD